MKKLICCLLVCTILLSMTACGEAKFESEEAMMEYMEGLWAHDYFSAGKVYYLFHDGKVYSVNQALYSESVDSVFEEYVEGNRFAELSELAFEDVKERSPLSRYIYDAEETEVRTKPRKGEISVGYERIHITDGEVTIRRYDEKQTQTMTKVSDASKSIEELMAGWFEEAKATKQISISDRIKSTEDYAAELKELHPEIRNWVLTEEMAGTKIYTRTGSVIGSGGILSISGSELSFNKRDAFTGENIINLSYEINSAAGEYHLNVYSTYGLSLEEVLKNAEPFLENIPGRQTTEQLVKLFEMGNVLKNGAREFETVLNSITYVIKQNNDGVGVDITVPDKVKLGDAT